MALTGNKGYRSAHLWWTVAVCALLVYGSLYPFEFVYPAPPGTWRTFVTLRPSDVHLGDVLANFLLFVPLGLVVALSLDSRRPGLLAALIVGLILGLGIQVVQIFVPARVPSLWDAGWNMLGAGVGALTPVRILRCRISPADPRAVFSLALIGLWLLVETFPLVPTLDWQTLKNSLKPLLLEPRLQPLAVGANVVGWAALTHLWRHGARLALPRAGPAAALVAVLAAQVLIVQRAPSLSGVIGGAAGILLALLPTTAERQAKGLLAILVVWLVVSKLDPMILRDSPAQFQWLPLAGFLNGGMLHGTWVALEKVFWFGLLVELMLAAQWPWRRTIVVGVLLIGGLEWGQRWVVGSHVAEITDPLMFLALATIRLLYQSGRGTHRSDPPV